MIHTGFYDIALRKAAERRQLQMNEENRMQRRMKELKIKIDD